MPTTGADNGYHQRVQTQGANNGITIEWTTNNQPIEHMRAAETIPPTHRDFFPGNISHRDAHEFCNARLASARVPSQNHVKPLLRIEVWARDAAALINKPRLINNNNQQQSANEWHQTVDQWHLSVD